MIVLKPMQPDDASPTAGSCGRPCAHVGDGAGEPVYGHPDRCGEADEQLHVLVVAHGGDGGMEIVASA